MGSNINSNIITNGLILHLDAANPKSYPGSGSVWYDLSGNNLHATYTTGSPNWVNNYLVMDGCVLTIPHNTIFNVNDMSVFFIGRYRSGEGRVICKGVTNYPGTFEIVSSSNTYLNCYQRSDGISQQFGHLSYPTSPSSNNGKFFIFSSTLNKTSLTSKLYYNDNFILNTGGSGMTNSTWYNTNPVLIGTRQDLVSPTFNGDLSNILLYNRALSDYEIRVNMNALKNRFNSF